MNQLVLSFSLLHVISFTWLHSWWNTRDRLRRAEGIVSVHAHVFKLIICHKYDCYQFYCCFQAKLGKYFTIPNGTPNLPQFRMVDVYIYMCTCGENRML